MALIHHPWGSVPPWLIFLGLLGIMIVAPEVQDTLGNKRQDSGVDLNVSIKKSPVTYPEPIVLQVTVNGPLPIIGARVRATALSPAGKSYSLTFEEKALLGGLPAQSGGYEATFTEIEENGIYNFKVEADDFDGRATFFWANHSESPPGTSVPGPPTAPKPVPAFRLESSVLVQTSGYSTALSLPPLGITDLSATLDKPGCVRLNWTVPPNIGPDGFYEIRLAPSPIISETDWNKTQLVVKDKYTQKGGTREERTICQLEKGTFFVAVVSVNRHNQRGNISNDYAVIIP